MTSSDKKNAVSGEMPNLWGGGAAAHEDEHPRAGWFKASKFAMFIHWGLYSEAANVWNGKNVHGIAEWLMRRERISVAEYETLAARFNPVDFNADTIAKLAKAAGMRYIVLTAKHHEGFALFKSEADPFNVVDATPFKRDIAGELADACRAHGLGIGFYYSQYLDWHEENAAGNDWDFGESRDFDRYFRKKALPQITELLTNYGPVSLIWFDTPGAMARESSQELYDLVRRLQPECLVNSRIGNGLGDYSSLGDQEVPLIVPEGPWETVDTHNDTWAYSIHDHHWKSERELISRLVRIASLGGTYMLNVSPTGKGNIPPKSARILSLVGDWLNIHGASIYGSNPSAIPAQPWGVVTTGPQKLYLHVLKWPADGELFIPGLDGVECRVAVMATGEGLTTRERPGVLIVEIPRVPPIAPVTVLSIDFVGHISTGGSERILHPGIINLFDAPFCETSSCRTGKRQWMEKFGDWHHADVVENIATGSTMSWPLTAVGVSTWTVSLEYECLPAADGSELELSLGESRWCFPVQATGCGHAGRTRLRRETLGMVRISEPGVLSLSLHATDIRGDGELIVQRAILEPTV